MTLRTMISHDCSQLLQPLKISDRYRVDHKDVVYFGSCAVVFMLPIVDMPLPSFSPMRAIVHPGFASMSFGPHLAAAHEPKPNTPFQSSQRLPLIYSPFVTRELKQQQQRNKDSVRRDLSTPTMSELRQNANAEVHDATPFFLSNPASVYLWSKRFFCAAHVSHSSCGSTCVRMDLPMTWTTAMAMNFRFHEATTSIRSFLHSSDAIFIVTTLSQVSFVEPNDSSHRRPPSAGAVETHLQVSFICQLVCP
jgi:hypothetical protein